MVLFEFAFEKASSLFLLGEALFVRLREIKELQLVLLLHDDEHLAEGVLFVDPVLVACFLEVGQGLLELDHGISEVLLGLFFLVLQELELTQPQRLISVVEGLQFILVGLQLHDDALESVEFNGRLVHDLQGVPVLRDLEGELGDVEMVLLLEFIELLVGNDELGV